MQQLRSKAKTYWSMTKSLQTGLLLTTGLAGYMSARCPVLNWQTLLMLGVSLFLSISGSTVLNMWYDRDIDARMKRTCWRPLPTGKVTPREALVLGAVLSILGVSLALFMDPLYGLVVSAGLFFDVIVYTIWLKRRSAWSIVWGGISGGMPVLAGRVLATGQVDWIGLTLSLAVLAWIPTHILTFNMRYFEDYQAAGVPTIPAAYGFRAARLVISAASVMVSLAMGVAALGIGLTGGYLHLMGLLSGGLLLLAVSGALRPSESLNFGLFKFASLYMLIAMLLVVFTGL
jgi:protoheme IX farnesyltransferase